VLDSGGQLKKQTTKVSLIVMVNILLTMAFAASESQHVTHRHEDKEKKLEKRCKKELRAAYRANPEVFEQEPSALHSDVDREEDTMVITVFYPANNC
jgi:hypothetical protein